MIPWLGSKFGNASSTHWEGREARRAVEDARDQVAELLGADPKDIILTSGATESNNLAIRCLVEAEPADRCLVISRVEHASILDPARKLKSQGASIKEIPVDREGLIDADALGRLLAEANPSGVCVNQAQNEIGSLQNAASIAQTCDGAGVPVHFDCAQACGKTDFSVKDLPLASVALSAHKLGGPKGIGALWVSPKFPVEPLLLGGGQERGRRAGTENVAAIVGFGEACRQWVVDGSVRREALQRSDRVLWAALTSRVPLIVRHGPKDPKLRLPGTLSLRIPGVSGERMVIGLDLRGFAISLGSACSSGAAQPSHVLEALGNTKVENLETFRVTLGFEHSAEELLSFAEACAEIAISKPA